MWCWIFRLNTLTALLLIAYVARAAPSELDRASARALAREGHAALQNRQYDVAADRFRRADALVHAPTLVLDMARALVGMGQLVEAQEKYTSILSEGVDAAAPKPWHSALAEARVELEKLKPRLSWLTIKVHGASEPKVSVDNVLLPATGLGVRRAANPGQRKVRVTAPGFLDVERTVALAEGGEEHVEITLERPHTAAPSASGVVGPLVPSSDARAPVVYEDVPETRRLLMYTAFGVGGMGLIVGSTFGVLALNKRSNLLDACGDADACPPSEQKNIDAYNRLGTTSGIGFAFALAGGSTGLALLLTEPDKRKAKQMQGLSVQPYAGFGAAGALGQF